MALLGSDVILPQTNFYATKVILLHFKTKAPIRRWSLAPDVSALFAGIIVYSFANLHACYPSKHRLVGPISVESHESLLKVHIGLPINGRLPDFI